jgi:hypothetical protein
MACQRASSEIVPGTHGQVGEIGFDHEHEVALRSSPLRAG